MVRATAITTPYGDLHPELLSAGHAIIHDKIIVIDPLDPVNCGVITGSHNLGYKASCDNDENLLIIRQKRKSRRRLCCPCSGRLSTLFDAREAGGSNSLRDARGKGANDADSWPRFPRDER